METCSLFMPLLTELGRSGDGFCYRHVAPNGAFNPPLRWPRFQQSQMASKIVLTYFRAYALRLLPAPVPTRLKTRLLSEPLDVGRPAAVLKVCATDKQPRTPAPKRTHNLGCA
jgi:hypothetical protein